jgi:hypothetical protein
MTAVQPVVDAAAVTLEDLRWLEAGTNIAWRGHTAAYGALFSALEREAPPNLLAIPGTERTVDLLQYQPDHRYRLVDAVTEDAGSVAAVLDQLAACVPAEPVRRFAGGIELDRAGLKEVPAVALWTGRTW